MGTQVVIPVGHAVEVALLSVAAGAISGYIAAHGMRIGFVAEFGAVFGGITGALFAPLLIWAVRDGGVLRAAVVVVPLSALGAWIGGAVTPVHGGPFIAAGVSLLAFFGACLAIRGWYRFSHLTPDRAT